MYVFRRPPTGGGGKPGWSQAAKLVPPAGQAGDMFGFSLGFNNGLIAVGSPAADSIGGGEWACYGGLC